MSNQLVISQKQKQKLRKLKTVTSAVKAVVYGGNLAGPAMASQFNSDVRLYGMYEALLYVHNYEKENHYKPGTASEAINAALTVDEDNE